MFDGLVKKIKNQTKIRENTGRNPNVGQVGRPLETIGLIRLLSLPILVLFTTFGYVHESNKSFQHAPKTLR